MFGPRFGRREKAELAGVVLRSFLARTPTTAEVEAYASVFEPADGPAQLVTTMLALLNPDGAPRFVPPGHHYSPITPTAEVDGHIARVEHAPAPDAVPDIAIDRAAMRALWAEFAPLLAEMPFKGTAAEGCRYRLDNPAYAWGDGMVLHAMLRRFRPRRVIEVGSGWSSACTLDTVERFLGGACEITLIEPYPDLVRTLLGPGPSVPRIIDQRVQDVPIDLFSTLDDGDILFIDSTHVLRTGSDVCWELFEILPRLRPGVLVHFHDIFWPFEYPRLWAVNENRSWNEMYGLRAMLMGSATWSVVFFNDFFAKTETALVERTYPDFLINPNGSIWLRKAR